MYNEFFCDNSSNCSTALWMILNEKKVKGVIGKTISNSSMRPSTELVDSIMSQVVQLFIESEEYAFDPTFFASSAEEAKRLEEKHKKVIEEIEEKIYEKFEMENRSKDKFEHSYSYEVNGDYSISAYVLNRVKTYAIKTVQEIREAPRNILSDDQIEKFGSYGVSEREVTRHYKGYDYSPDVCVEREGMQEFYDGINQHEVAFKMKNLCGDDFDTQRFIKAIFLDGAFEAEDIAKMYGIETSVYNVYIKYFRQVATADQEFKKSLTEWVSGIARGWRP